MKTIVPLTLIGAVLLAGASLHAQTWVNGYTRQDGGYTQGHYRSSPNGTTADNWSTRGNTNPYTGQQGTRSYDNGLQHYGNSYGSDNSYRRRW